LTSITTSTTTVTFRTSKKYEDYFIRDLRMKELILTL